MGLSEQSKGFINNVAAGAVWDGIKQLWGPVVLAAIVAVWEKIKHGALDWVAIVGMFLFASLLAFLNFRKPKQLQEGKPQQWKPAWQRLQWANADRERLEKELEKLKAVQPKPSQYPIPPFRLQLFAMCSELQGFLGEFGEEPRIQGVDELYADVIPWRTKVGAAYRLRFANAVRTLRDEIAHKTGISDPVLDKAMNNAATDEKFTSETIRTIVAKLGEIALRVNA